MNGILLRKLEALDLPRIREIDRSEQVNGLYVYRDGALELQNVDIDVPAWSPTGVQRRIEEWLPLFEIGGIMIGAFDGPTLVAFVIYRPNLDTAMAQLAVLYTSSGYRGRGIGSALMREAVELATAAGARTLYVSSAPTATTVDFYRRHGFELADDPHPRLYALEPEDIHMTLRL